MRKLVLLALTFVLIAMIPLQARAVAAGSTIPWVGGNWYLFGADYPWDNYGNDFGSNAWGAYGVHAAGTNAQVDADFAGMAAEGIHSTRWWVFSDGRAGITFDQSGTPTGIDQYVFPDLDAAVQIAAKHGIYLNLVLLDFSFMANATMTNGVQLGGHANVINTAAGQQSLMNNVIVPVLKRYGNSSQIISWEVMNEPEWAIIEDAVNSNIGQPSTLANFLSFTKTVASAVHTYTHSYVTVGGADMKWVKQWQGNGLDYYQIHYYDWMQPYADQNPYGTTYASLGLDAPVVIGEYPAGSSSTATLQQYLDTWFGNGYAGQWTWSYKQVDGNGAPDSSVMQAWASAHSALVNIAPGSPSPSPTPSPTPPPPPPPPPPTAPFKGLYTMDGYGGLHPDSVSVVTSPPVSASAYWGGWKIARAAKALPGANAPQDGMVLDGYGGLHSYGSPAVIETNTGGSHRWGFDIARDFAFLPDGTGGFVLDGYGGLHGFRVNGSTAALQVVGGPYWAGWDIARKVVIFPDGSGGYVLDGYGGVHAFGINGPAPASVGQLMVTSYWNWNIARDIELIPGNGGHSGYVLDGYGGTHPFHPTGDGSAQPAMLAGASYWGWDIARGMWMLPGSSNAGYTLDGYGGLHPFGGAPAITNSPYWPGWDIARAVWGA